jgi:hypothetical protein
MGISFVKSRLFSAVPEGTAALFFIQIFATLGFAVLYSTLVLYATKHLHLGVKEATTLTGVAAGNKDKAEALYKDISTYNFNGIDYALVRNEVVNRKPAM